MDRKSKEEGAELQPELSNPESGDSLHRTLELAERIDDLGWLIQRGRRWRLAIPVLAGMTLGAATIVDLDWGFLVKLALGFGLAVAFSEFVLWRFSRRIEAWEGEIERATRLPKDAGTSNVSGELDSSARV